MCTTHFGLLLRHHIIQASDNLLDMALPVFPCGCSIWHMKVIQLNETSKASAIVCWLLIGTKFLLLQ